MSYSVTVYVRDAGTDELVVLLRERFNTVVSYSERASELVGLAEVFGVRVAVGGQNGLEDNCGIQFSLYGADVEFSVSAGTIDPTVGPALCRAMALAFATKLANARRRECLVVEGVQRVIAKVVPP
jgi:hypothetical protein